MTELVSYSLSDNIATVTINNGKVNAISSDVLGELNQALDQAEQDKAVVILTGQVGIFSAGYDLRVMQKDPAAMLALVKAGSQMTRRMLAFPFPIVVACGGHAIAKGAFILLSADYRIGVEGDYKLGLNEVAIGMTMHHVGIELARGRMSNVYFNRSVINGEMYSPQQAIDAGFLDSVVSADNLLNTAQKAAAALSKIDMKAHAQTKVKARAQLLKTLDEAIELDANVRF